MKKKAKIEQKSGGTTLSAPDRMDKKRARSPEVSGNETLRGSWSVLCQMEKKKCRQANPL